MTIGNKKYGRCLPLLGIVWFLFRQFILFRTGFGFRFRDTRGRSLLKALVIVLLIVASGQGGLWPAIPAAERAALITFYNNTGGDRWTSHGGWKTPPLDTDGFAMPGTENTWAGVGVANDHVIYVKLNYNNLSGPIHPALGDLEQLEELSLESNFMNGTIPPELGNLTHLKILNLDHTWSSGTIPPALGNLVNLEELYLCYNQLTGSIPPELGNLGNLRIMNLGTNQLSGSIPPQLGNLGKLENLYLWENQLTGSIPPELGNLSNLKILQFSMNRLSGPIPPELGNLSNLIQLTLWDNQLSGTIPTELGNLSNVGEINISNNQLSGSLPAGIGNLSKLNGLLATDNQLTGIPPEIGNLTGILKIDLGNNKISGIPTEIGNLKNLYSLNLGNNEISSLPAGIGNLTNLNRLNLSNNRISSLPPEIGNLGNLHSLVLDSNDLSGSFPAELYNLKLTTLGLCNNRLSGGIPSWVCHVVSNSLYLSYNQFSGTIPRDLRYLPYLYLDHNQLSGPIPDELTYAQILYLNSNKLSGSLPPGFSNWNKYSERELDVRYNSLYTGDDVISNNVNNFCYQWKNTQTVAPTNVNAEGVSSSAVIVSWTPILYTADPGGYLVYYGSSARGPWIYSGKTVDKTISSFTVNGLSPNTLYYFHIKAQTDPHSENTNVVTSEASPVVSAATAGIEVTYTLTVQSSPDTGVSIAVSPVDKNNKGNGITLFTRTYYQGTIVSLTAPATFNGKDFSKWLVDGIQRTGSAVQITMDSNHTAIALYVIKEPPVITLSRTNFNFGVKLPVHHAVLTGGQSFLIGNSGGGTLHWSAVQSHEWLNVVPSSGTGNGKVVLSVYAAGLPPGTYTATVTVSDPAAANSPQTVTVNLKVYQETNPPFGSFDTPRHGAVVQGSIAVTGWALDDIGIENVKIYRDENNSLVYIGDALLVEGARPDIEAIYPEYPKSYKAGWGYMMLTNFLPNGGNGWYMLHAVATDKEGNSVTLDSINIKGDNANAVKPFGAIDTPGQGGTASGSQYRNYGWALTPPPNTIPIDGTTLQVWVDGVSLGHPVYNQYRSDVAQLFPGYNNSNGAGGCFVLDTTGYESGVHTIFWTAMDNAGSIDGIGSRYFTIQNLGGSMVQEKCNETNASRAIKSFDQTFSKGGWHPQPIRPPAGQPEAILLQRGYSTENGLETLYPDEKGQYTIEIKELERLVIYLGEHEVEGNVEPCVQPIVSNFHLTPNTEHLTLKNTPSRYQGYLVNGDDFRPLPIGSTLDGERGVFYWQAGPGFLGEYRLLFIKIDYEGNTTGKDVRVNIISKF